MLYLVKLDNTYKIGFSSNVEERMKSFKTTHIVVEVIATREGTITEEKCLHRLCNAHHIQNELFNIHEEVENIFKTHIFDDILEENIKLKKENNKLKMELDYYKKLSTDKNNKVLEEAIPISTKTLQTYAKGKLVTYGIKYYDEYIAIGDLIVYDKLNKKIMNNYGNSEAKKYTTQQGVEIYYIATGVSLNMEQINKIIND